MQTVFSAPPLLVFASTHQERGQGGEAVFSYPESILKQKPLKEKGDNLRLGYFSMQTVVSAPPLLVLASPHQERGQRGEAEEAGHQRYIFPKPAYINSKMIKIIYKNKG